jgi:hypothetical protein
MQFSSTDFVTVAVLGTVAFRLFGGLRHAFSTNGRSLILDIVRGIRWRHIWPVPFVLALVVFASALLTQIPGLDWGWWSALGGEGNPAFGSNKSTNGTVGEWLIPAAFVLMLVPALPLFAHAEERMFRSGAEGWSSGRRMYKIISFGLIHALIGIQIGVALALSIGGAYFMWAYLRDYQQSRSTQRATIESARAHTAYNGLIIGLFALVLVLSAAIS